MFDESPVSWVGQRFSAGCIGLTLAVALCSGGCHADSAESAAKDAKSMTPETPATNSKPAIIEAGECRGIAIGMTRDQAMVALIGLGVTVIQAEVANPIRVTEASALNELRDAAGIKLLPGDVVVRFSGEAVQSTLVSALPKYDRWRARIYETKTRAEVFKIFSEMLAALPGRTVVQTDQIRVIYFQKMEKPDREFLAHTGLWNASLKEDSGWTYLELAFDSLGQLRRIECVTSPTELP